MPEVHQIIVQVKAPKKGFAGQVAYGFFTVANNIVTMTTQDGKPAGEETGRKWSRMIGPTETARSVAAKMTKELRLALRPGGKAPTAGFDRGPLKYPPLKY